MLQASVFQAPGCTGHKISRSKYHHVVRYEKINTYFNRVHNYSRTIVPRPMWPYETAKILKSLKTKIPKVIDNLNIKFKKAKKCSVDSKSLRREFTLIYT